MNAKYYRLIKNIIQKEKIHPEIKKYLSEIFEDQIYFIKFVYVE